jgi:DNA-binding protein YbaB
MSSSEMPDFNQLLAQAQQMQEQLAVAQQELASQVVEGQSGGGAVRVGGLGGLAGLMP